MRLREGWELADRQAVHAHQAASANGHKMPGVRGHTGPSRPDPEGAVMATANYEVRKCECTHGEDQHGIGKNTGCGICPCDTFKPQPVKEGDTVKVRRITED